MQRSHSTVAAAVLLGAFALGLSACDAAPPEGAEGAAGEVSLADPDSGEMPKPTSVGGGPAGQTPEYGEPGGAVGDTIPSESAAKAQSRAAAGR